MGKHSVVFPYNATKSEIAAWFKRKKKKKKRMTLKNILPRRQTQSGM